MSLWVVSIGLSLVTCWVRTSPMDLSDTIHVMRILTVVLLHLTSLNGWTYPLTCSFDACVCGRVLSPISLR